MSEELLLPFVFSSYSTARRKTVPALRCRHIVMLPWSHLLHQVCGNLAQPPPTALCGSVSGDREHQSRVVRPNCTVRSSSAARYPTASASAAQFPDCACFSLVLPDCVLFSCCSSSASACYHAHAVQSMNNNNSNNNSFIDSGGQKAH